MQNLFDRVTGDAWFKTHGKDIGWKSLDPRSPSSPLTWQSFKRCLSFAILCPLIFLTLLWGFTNEGVIFYWTFSALGLPLGERLLVVMLVMLAYGFGRFVRKKIENSSVSTLRKELYSAFAFVLAFAFPLAFSFNLIGAFTFTLLTAVGGSATALEGGDALILLVTSKNDAISISYATALACAVAFAFASAGAIAGAFTIAVAAAVGFHFSFHNFGDVASAIAFAGTAAGGIILSLKISGKLNRVSAYGRVAALICMGAVIALMPLPAKATGDVVYTLIFEILIPLFILPFVNACFCWVLLATTRLLLACQLKLDSPPARLFTGLADLALALPLVPLLRITYLRTTQYFEFFGIHTIFYVSPFLKYAFIAKSAQIFLVLNMLFTTLIPTLIYLAFVLCALAAQTLHLLPWFRRKIE